MKCSNCKFYRSGTTENECKLTGDYCFRPFISKECTLINDSYIIIEEYAELVLGLKLGQDVSLLN